MDFPDISSYYICMYLHTYNVRYQKFEYAVGHWLQKATEHVLGCVLCSPGCFSLFRAKAIMDDNVMAKYVNIHNIIFIFNSGRKETLATTVCFQLKL